MSVNKLILKQLEEVRVANVSEYDELHHAFHIKKYQEPTFEQNKLYIAKLDEHLLSADGNTLLVSNWNNGKFPTHQYVKFAVHKKIAKMIYVYGVYYDIENKKDLEDEWVGWLPIEQLEIIEVI